MVERREVRESHPGRGMVDGCRWGGGGVGNRLARVWVNCLYGPGMAHGVTRCMLVHTVICVVNN